MVSSGRALAGRTFSVFAALMGSYFLFATVVQLNDPDPIRWMAIYGTAAAVSLISIRKPLPPLFPAAIGAIALAWALLLLPSALETSLPEMFRSFEMMGRAMEEGRETLGLTVVVVWMAFLTARELRVRKGPSGPRDDNRE